MPYSPEEVADRMEIQDKINMYCHAFDRFDYDALDAVFAPECKFDFTHLNGGTRDWVFMKKFLKKFHHPPHDQHYYTNIYVEFDDETRTSAHSYSKVFNPLAAKKNDDIHFFSLYGTYHDWWRKTEDGWFSFGRKWEMNWMDGDYPFDQPPGSNLPQPDEL